MIKKALVALALASATLAVSGAGAVELVVVADDPASKTDTLGSFVVGPGESGRFHLAVDGLSEIVTLPGVPANGQLFLEITFAFSLTSPVGAGQRFFVRPVSLAESTPPLYPPAPATTIPMDPSLTNPVPCSGGAETDCGIVYSVELDGPYLPPALSAPIRLATFDIAHDPLGSVGDTASFSVGVSHVAVTAITFDEVGNIGDVLIDESRELAIAAPMSVTAIPEPSTVWLCAAGLLTVAAVSARRRTRPTAPAVS
jgi:hypothetical protein